MGLLCIALAIVLRCGGAERSCVRDFSAAGEGDPSPRLGACLLSSSQLSRHSLHQAGATTAALAAHVRGPRPPPAHRLAEAAQVGSVLHLGHEVLQSWAKWIQDNCKLLVSKFREEIRFVLHSLMPGFRIDNVVLYRSSLSVVAAIGWLYFWVTYIYQTDRDDTLDRWSSEIEAAPPFDKGRPDDIEPDFILIVRNPMANVSGSLSCFGSRVDDVCISTAALQRVSKYSDDWLPRLQSYTIDHSSRGAGAAVRATTAARFLGSQTLAASTDASAFGQLSQSLPLSVPKGASRRSAMVAFLQDLNSSLPMHGFDVQVFRSLGGDELQVCISLINEEVIKMYLQRYSLRLQLQKSLVKKLGIIQNPEEPASSPPRVRYDPFILERLQDADIDTEGSFDQVYRTYRVASGARKSLVNRTDRIRIIHRVLTEHIDIDAAKDEGLLLDVFPDHDFDRIRKLSIAWANWAWPSRYIWDSPVEFMRRFFVQPIPAIRGYFGARIAFAFAWQGLYTKCLVALVPLACFYRLLVLANSEDPKSYPLLGYSIVLIIWGQVAFNLWDREQAFFVRSWDIDREDHMVVMRSKFRGNYAPSPVDSGIMEKQYPKRWSQFWCVMSALITAVCCLVVLLCVWLQKKMSNYWIAWLAIAAQVQVFEICFDLLVVKLTDWENHRSEADHYDSFLWKQAVFQSVNSYSPFLWTIVQHLHTGHSECANDDCMEELENLLSWTLGALILCRLGKTALFASKVHFWLWYEHRKFRRKHSLQADAPVDVNITEQQASFMHFGGRELGWAMLHPVLTLGFVLLFGVIAPLFIVFLVLAVFWVQLRASAFLLTHCAKRPLPVDTRGIGTWRDIVQSLMYFGRLTTGMLVVCYGQAFQGRPVVVKLSGFMLFCLIAHATSVLVSIVCSTDDPLAHLLAARRNHVEAVVSRTSGHSRDWQLSADCGPQHRGSDAVAKGDWSYIPLLSGGLQTDQAD